MKGWRGEAANLDSWGFRADWALVPNQRDRVRRVVTVRPDVELPQPEDPFDEKLFADIREHGWHVVLVADEHHPQHAQENRALGPHPIYDAAFAYTVGISVTCGHAEVVLVGRWQQPHTILNVVGGLIGEGCTFAPGNSSDEVLEGYTVRFGSVSDARRVELLTYADWVNARRPFQAVQLVLPDRDGRWPEDPEYDSYPQPLLTS